MNGNAQRLLFFTLLVAVFGLLWSVNAYAGGGHIIGPVGAPEATCDGIDDEPDGFIDDGFHDADMAFGSGDGVADCIDTGDADGDGIPDNVENPDGIWGNADDYGDPELADTDGDGLNDGVEDANHNGTLDAGETDVTNPDTDGDGVPDGVEVSAGYDPLNTDTDSDGLTDGVEDSDFDGILDPNECSPILANTDGVSADDGQGNEGFADTDSDGIANCQDNNNDNDGLTDDLEDLDNDGVYDTPGECNLIVANTDGVSANDGVGAEGTSDTDGDTLLNCEDTNNDNDSLADNLEDINGNGTYQPGGECNLVNANTDGVSANDGVGNETQVADTDGDGLRNCEDVNNDNDGLTDDQEDLNNSGLYEIANDACNLVSANTDGVSANDGVGTEGTSDTDGDGLQNCEDNNNDGDAYTDAQEDRNNNGTFEAANDACNLNAANTDGVSANDGVGAEDTSNTDGDGLQNCEDPDNDNDGLNDGAEDLNNNGVFNSPGECNLINKNTDAVNGNDGDPIEGMTDTDGDGRPNCNDTDNDNDGIIDTQDPTPNVAFDCDSAVKIKYLTPTVTFTAANQKKTVRVKITRNLVGKNPRLLSVDPTATSPDIVDVTNVSPVLPRTITSSVTFTITVQGPAMGPFPVTVNFPTAEFIPSFPGSDVDTEGANRLDYTFNCGTYIALSDPKPSTLELRDLRSYIYNSQLVFEALGKGVQSLNVQLYDISGRTILQAEAPGSLVSLPLSGVNSKLSNGVYLAVLTVRGWDGQIVRSEVRKIVVKR
jgi:hypothetical protein